MQSMNDGGAESRSSSSQTSSSMDTSSHESTFQASGTVSEARRGLRGSSNQTGSLDSDDFSSDQSLLALEIGSTFETGSFRVQRGLFQGQPVAIKSVPLLDIDGVAMIRHEYSIYEDLTSLQGFSIPKVLFAGPYNGSFLLITQYVGESMSAYADAANPVRRALNQKVVQIVKEIHALSILHGDIKLENFVVREKDCKVFAVDFHLAGRASNDGELQIEMIAARVLFSR